MRNLITGIFAILAGTVLFYGNQALLDDDSGKSKDQIKAVQDSLAKQKQPDKTPAPLDSNHVN